MAFRVLAAGNFPQHPTVCEVRRRHFEDFELMFVEVVRVAREMGVVRFGTLSVDGTNVRANQPRSTKKVTPGPPSKPSPPLGANAPTLPTLPLMPLKPTKGPSVPR